MTELDIQKRLFDTFKTLNEFSGVEFLETDKNGNCLNAHFPNAPFSEPESKRWFELTFRSGEPEDAALMEGAQSRFAGVLYVDVITPQDAGEDEAWNKYRWIARLFNGADIEDVDILKVYVATKENEAGHYRLLVAVEWTADIDKELKDDAPAENAGGSKEEAEGQTQ